MSILYIKRDSTAAMFEAKNLNGEKLAGILCGVFFESLRYCNNFALNVAVIL